MRTELKQGEKMVLLTRPHIITLLFPGIVGIIFIIIGFFLISYNALLIGLIFFLLAFLYVIYKILKRKYNIWVITDLRVIDEFGVLSHNAKESPLDKIHNVLYKQSILGRVFDFGNVQIQTAAEIGSTTYFSVENPKLLKDTITKMQEDYKTTMIKKQASELANAVNNRSFNDIASEIEKLHELKVKGIITEEEFLIRKNKILNL